MWDRLTATLPMLLRAKAVASHPQINAGPSALPLELSLAAPWWSPPLSLTLNLRGEARTVCARGRAGLISPQEGSAWVPNREFGEGTPPQLPPRGRGSPVAQQVRRVPALWAPSGRQRSLPEGWGQSWAAPRSRCFLATTAPAQIKEFFLPSA